jgi:hypothetical protein
MNRQSRVEFPIVLQPLLQVRSQMALGSIKTSMANLGAATGAWEGLWWQKGYRGAFGLVTRFAPFCKPLSLSLINMSGSGKWRSACHARPEYGVLWCSNYSVRSVYAHLQLLMNVVVIPMAMFVPLDLSLRL